MPESSSVRARSWLILPLASLCWACGPGRLPDLGFGSAGTSAADSAGETSDDDGPGPTTIGDDSSGSADGETGSGAGDGDTGTGDGDTGSSTGDGDTGTGDGDGDTGSGGDGDTGSSTGDGDTGSGSDTWGIPPDVTNEPCEPLTQDCYPTHKCVPYATQPGSSFLDANKCMPILGDKAWDEPCTLSSYQEGQDDCDGEGFCWNLEWVGGELQGTCVPFCLGTPQDLQCPLGWGCLFSGALSLCALQCEPLLQDCPVDYGCYWTGNNFQCLLTATLVGVGQSCDEVNECLPGLACVDKALVPGCVGPEPGCCTPWCEVASDDCSAPLHCEPFFAPDDDPPASVGDLGVCVL